ncbi:MAG TPA: hypothetical protein DDW52_02540 [Planctomycetaceae bacterium]|nr:hypothetical protein [Planctomycetaceae bacterium]
MKRWIILLYGLCAYGFAMASLFYMIGWLGNWLPRSIDAAPSESLAIAALINLFVFVAFGIQHSVMARPAFKKALTKLIPESAERSTYVLCSGVCLFAIMLLWQPMGGQIWKVDNQPLRCVLHSIYAIGWVVLVGSTFALNHFDLFGLRQVWLQFRGKPYTHLEFAAPGPYRFVRHPIYVGWIILAWATPDMTWTHLVFAVATTLYIVKAIGWEEKDLVDYHGKVYESYRDRTPKLIPSLPGDRVVAPTADV